MAGWQVVPWPNRVQAAAREAERDVYRAMAQQRAEREARIRERARDHDLARERARALLEACLSPAQYRAYSKGDGFELTSDRGHQWLIRNSGPSSSIMLLGYRHPFRTGSGEKRIGLCAYPRDVPLPDMHLAQALTVLTDERLFLHTAWPPLHCGEKNCRECARRPSMHVFGR